MKTKNKMLNIGIIGVGGIGQAHCRTIQKIDEMQLTAVADIDKKQAEKVGQEYNVPYFYNHRNLIKSGLCDAVIVGTPHPEHAKPSMDCLRAGLHVLCEKPLTEKVSSARDMVKLAKNKKRVLAVNFPLRFVPQNNKAIEIVRSGKLGKIHRAMLILPEFRSQGYYNSGTWRATWNGEGGGVLLNQAPHFMDLFVQMTGLPSAVFGVTETRHHDIEVENFAEALLRFPDAGTGYIYTSTLEPDPGKQIDIIGDKGKLLMRNGKIELYKYEKGSLEKSIKSKSSVWGGAKCEPVPFEVPDQTPQSVHINFARHILYKEPLLIPGESGLASLELANAITLSSEIKEWVKLPISRKKYDEFLKNKRINSTYIKKNVKEQKITDPRIG